MKNPLIRNNHNRPAGKMRPALAALALLVLAICPARAQVAPANSTLVPSLVFPPQSAPYGHSYPEWAARFWQRTLSLPVDAASFAAPLSDGQSGQVWLIAPPLGVPSSATFQFSIPEGKAMLISPLSAWMDNGNCPTFTDFSVDELRALVSAEWSPVSEMSFTIDGVAIPGLTNPQASPYLFDSTVFSYTLPDHDTYPTVLFGATCIANGTTIGPAVVKGVFLLVKPLPVGQHLIHMTAGVGPASAPFLVTDVTFVITVTGD
jgi:hypothetical protein